MQTTTEKTTVEKILEIDAKVPVKNNLYKHLALKFKRSAQYIRITWFFGQTFPKDLEQDILKESELFLESLEQ